MHSATPFGVDFQTALARFCNGPESLAPLPRWLHAIQQLGMVLGGAPTHLAAFTRAWRTLYSATLLLDHVQDGDELDNDWLATLPAALQYHLAFSAYAVAQRQLHELTECTSSTCGAQLHSLWSAAVLELAIGQYHDLTALHYPVGSQPVSLDAYERIAAQKTGAVFGLALGAAVALARDDTAQIDAATNAGLVFGMLLQYRDDLVDVDAQATQPAALTLTRAWTTPDGIDAPAIASSAVWGLIYVHYQQALDAILAPLPEPGRAVIQTLLHDSFGTPPELPVSARRGAPWSVTEA